MRNKVNHTDDLFRNILSHDNPGIKPAKAIEERLNYYYMLKQPTLRIHINSFGGMFVWLFSLKSIGFKASLASACLLYFLFLGNIKNNGQNQQSSDSCQISSVVVDTSYLTKDSCK